MSSSSGNRLLAITPDNHQPWLWVMHVFFIILVSLTAILRVKVRRKQTGKGDAVPLAPDAVLLVAHLLYIAYWIAVTVSLLNSLGRSNTEISELREIKASKLVFASRPVLVVVLSLAQTSTALLIRFLFFKHSTKTKIWFWATVALSGCGAHAGSLMISVHCSPARTLTAGDDTACSNNAARWIVLTVFEAILELTFVVQVAIAVSGLQMMVLTDKLWVVASFFLRLVVWIPAWLHLAIYIDFMRSGRTNIDIVPTMICEDLWIALSLVSASIPVLLRVAKKFTTTGMVVGRTTVSRSTKTLVESVKMKSVTTGETNPPSDKLVLRPDNDGTCTASVFARTDEATSVNSAESQVGILREDRFEVLTCAVEE